MSEVEVEYNCLGAKDADKFVSGLKKLVGRFLRKGDYWACINTHLFVMGIIGLREEGWTAEQFQEALDKVITKSAASTESPHQ